jgi:hypothetical protein
MNAETRDCPSEIRDCPGFVPRNQGLSQGFRAHGCYKSFRQGCPKGFRLRQAVVESADFARELPGPGAIGVLRVVAEHRPGRVGEW